MYSYTGANLEYKNLSRRFWRLLLTFTILMTITSFVSIFVALAQLAKDASSLTETDHFYNALPTLLVTFFVSLLGVSGTLIENNGILLRYLFWPDKPVFYHSLICAQTRVSKGSQKQFVKIVICQNSHSSK